MLRKEIIPFPGRGYAYFARQAFCVAVCVYLIVRLPVGLPCDLLLRFARICIVSGHFSDMFFGGPAVQ